MRRGGWKYRNYKRSTAILQDAMKAWAHDPAIVAWCRRMGA